LTKKGLINLATGEDKRETILKNAKKPHLPTAGLRVEKEKHKTQWEILLCGIVFLQLHYYLSVKHRVVNFQKKYCYPK